MESNTAIRDTLNCRVNQTDWQIVRRNLISGRMSAGSTKHACIKHNGIQTYNWKLQVTNKVK